mmetsp:Transcript_5938/g.14075  ORF Transcript_5938/g.14075 Transcript_5938/m.14075 type:complete len:328 (+) Transcript_5938:110-1093(+)
MQQRMDSLLADCLPLLSDHLEVIDLFRLESVSKQLQETIRHGDNLFHRAIRGEVGYDQEYPSTIPVMKFEDEEKAKWDRYSAKSYPAKLCFHAKLAHDGIVVEDLSVDKIRKMGKSMASFRDDLKKAAPPREDGPVDWDQWYCPGYLGLRGGSVSLDFKIVCGFVLVFSIREKHEYKNEYGYEYYHGFFDELNQRFHCAVERETVPLRSDDDIPYAYKPYSFYDDWVEDKIDIWSRVNVENSDGSKLRWLRDSSGTIFAITMGKQLLTRKLQNAKYFRPSLTHDQGEIAKRFLAPHVWARGATVYNANRMLGLNVTLEEFESVKKSL